MNNIIVPPYFTELVFDGLLISMVSLGFVYLFGRLLNIFESPRAKNYLATVFLIIGSILYTLVTIYDTIPEISYWDKVTLFNIAYLSSMKFSFAVICHVIIGWKFYDRMDAFLDARLGKDKNNPT